MLGTTVAPIEAFAIAETTKSGRTYYHSQIIARKDSGIKTVNDLKGKTFAFVDPTSTSGHLFPKAGLIKLGIDPDTDFGRVIFTGSHDANALAVANKQGRCRHDRRPHPRCRRSPRAWSSARTSRSCGAPIRSPNRRRCGARTSRRSSRRKVKAAFLNIKDITWSDQGKLNGFVETNDAAYDVIRDTAKLAQPRPEKMK